MCPDCKPFTDELEKMQIRFLYLDITENLSNLKKFLKLRAKPEFMQSINEESIGIPVMSINDGEKILFSIDEVKNYLENTDE